MTEYVNHFRGRTLGTVAGWVVSFADDFDEDAVGQGRVAEDVDDTVFGEAAEHGVGFGVGVGRGLGPGGVGGGLERGRGGLAGGWGTGITTLAAAHAPVHGLVGEAVGVLVFVAEGVGYLEGFESGDAVFGLLPEGSKVGGVDFVLALDLLDHELGVRDDAEAGVVVVEGVLEAGKEAGVFGEVVGAHAEEFAEFGKDHAPIVLDDGSVAGGTGVAAGSAVAMGVDPVGFLGVGSRRWRGLGEEAWGGGGAGGHRKSLRESVPKSGREGTNC
jgi:hypothetical protein